MTNFKKLFSENSEQVTKLGITFNPPAPSAEIEKLELVLKQPLPIEFVAFYKFCNGFETDDEIFRVIPIQETIEQRHELGPKTFHFAEYLIYSDVWSVQIHNLIGYDVLNGDHDVKKLKVQTNSITTFIEVYLDGGLWGNEKTNFWDRLDALTPKEN